MADDESPDAAQGSPDDGPPRLSKAESAEIARAARVTDADIDEAGATWARYAPEELAGLWDAQATDDD